MKVKCDIWWCYHNTEVGNDSVPGECGLIELVIGEAGDIPECKNFEAIPFNPKDDDSI